MWNIFKVAKQKAIEIVENKSTQEIIEEIHNEFDTAGEKLLNEAKEIIANNKFNDEKTEKLKALGFTNVLEVVETETKKIKKELASRTVQLIQDYFIKYPNYKFITEEMVEAICKKYNLVCGDVSLYKGFVPLHNLNQIEKFKVNEEDLVQYYIQLRNEKMWKISSLKHQDIKDYYCEIYLREYESHYTDYMLKYDTYPRYTRICNGNKQNLNKLKICAPLKEMNTEGMELNGYHLQKHIPDPVILQPVIGGYLIITAWGDEASDPLVVNEKMN